MTMTRPLRRLVLLAHVTFSVGWLGAVVAYLALAIAGLNNNDAQGVHAAYLAMDLTGWCVIIPMSLAALLTGLVQSLGTEWGFFRYYWVLVKFVLTVGAITILLLHMPVVHRMSGAAAEVIHAGGGLLALLVATALSVYKPWGRTRYGRRTQHQGHHELAVDSSVTIASTAWGLYVLLGTIGLVLLFVAMHLTASGHRGH